MSARWPVLVVDDEPVARESLAAWLREDGHVVDTAGNSDEALARAAKREYAVYLIDLKMPPGPDGIETMRRVRELHPEAAVVIFTAFATVDSAIEAMKEGAQDYLVKPCNPTEVSLLVERLFKLRRLVRENRILRKRLLRRFEFRHILSKSERMQAIFTLIRRVAPTRTTVLIEGESGTGKDLLARAIHRESDRADRPFVGVSCAALAETLLESELFGYERGAFTGAQERRKGKIELAQGGTLFLDEIGDIPPKLQMDLLRVLQERKFFRVGGLDEVSVDVRIIAATNQPLLEAVRVGRFREDLFYRLNVVSIQVPPLRERKEDIPLLASRFLDRFGTDAGKDGMRISEKAMARLMAHAWPGNVRELENAIERAVVTCDGDELGVEDFAHLQDAPVRRDEEEWGGLPLWQVEKRAVEATLKQTGGNISEAATVLQIDRSTLYEKIKRYGIPR